MNKNTSTKEQFDLIQENYIKQCAEDGIEKGLKKDFFDKAIHAILELRKCEDEYSQDKSLNYPIQTYFEGIDCPELDELCRININNDKILPETSISFDSENFIDQPDNDFSGVYLEPVFDRLSDTKYINGIVGVKFIIQSQMGYEIQKTEVDIDSLKRLREQLNDYIERIEEKKSKVKVYGYGSIYEFNTHADFVEFPEDLIERTERLICDHGFPDKFSVTRVERDRLGDEIWYVEGFEELNSNKYKIILDGYPCRFTFVVSKQFKPFNKENNYDEERQSFLVRKMKKFKLPTNGHDYTDFIIEHVEKFKGGEVWVLGS
jgi:hypothetical protein